MSQWDAPRREKTDKDTWRSPISWDAAVSALPIVFACAILLVIAIHPRNIDPQQDRTRGNRFLPEEVGYKASIDALAQMDVFIVRELPAGPGLPTRLGVAINEEAFTKAESNGSLCDEGLIKDLEGSLDWLPDLFSSTEESEVSPCRELLNDYRQATFLRQDMLRASRQTWLLDGNDITGMRAQAHALRESGYDPISTQGKIAYASQSTQPEESWTLVDPVSLTARPLTLDPQGTRCDLPGANSAIETHCFSQGVIVVLPPQRFGQTVFLNGKQVTDPNAERSPNTTRLLAVREGSTLALAQPGQPPEQTWQLLKRRANLSEVRNGVRFRDPAFAGLASQIDIALTTTLTSTVDRNLQNRAQTALDSALERAPERAGFSLRGALALMDGLSGRIVAGATFPSKPDHLLKRDQDTPQKVAWLQQNQVFEALPVGSTAKVPFAAAITTAQPDLLRLRQSNNFAVWDAGSRTIRYNARRFLRTGSFEESLSSGPGTNTLKTSRATNYDFENALVQSDNPYAVRLLREAWHSNRSAPQDADWLYNLRVLSCGAPRYEAREAFCPVYLWSNQDNPDRGLPHPGVRFLFDEERVSAAPHNALFLGALGNGGYNWTLAQLTQSYARIMSGTTVSATLVSGSRAVDPLSGFLRGEGYERSWRAIMRSLRGVVARGTASVLSDTEAAVGPGVFLYAKTGTPTTGYGVRKDGKVFVLAAIRTRDGLAPEVSGRRDQICSMRFLSINLQFSQSGTNIATSLAKTVIENDEAIREWLTAQCPTEQNTAENGGSA